MDYFEEENEANLWNSTSSRGTITWKDISKMAISKLETCEGFCESREISGEDSCFCIRNRFPTPDHYKLYKATRRRYEKMLNAGLAIKAVATRSNGD